MRRTAPHADSPEAGAQWHSAKRALRFSLTRAVRDNWIHRRMIAELCRHEEYSGQELRGLARRLLLQTLRTADRRIPGYRGMSAGISEANVEEVLAQRFPVVTKQDLRSRPDLFYPNQSRIRPWTIVGETGGTTGTPLQVIRSPASVLWQNAFLKRQWIWVGFEDGMPRASLRGDMVVPIEQKEPPFWYMNRFNNQLLFSVSHLSEDTADLFIAKLKEFRPFLMEAYPSAAYELARYLSMGGKYLSIPYIFTGSEPLYDEQRRLIAERFNARVMDHYGMGERVAFATECEFGGLHVNTDHSYLEIVDEEGRRTDGYGYIVGTTFHNLSMPLLRYQLLDRSRWKLESCPCARSYPMIEKVAGRFEDRIIGRKGNDISSVLWRVVHGVSGVELSQIAQTGPDRLEVRVVPGVKFGERERHRIIGNVRKLVDPGMKTTVKVVDGIPRTSRGKYRWLVNEYKDGRRSASG